MRDCSSTNRSSSSAVSGVGAQVRWATRKEEVSAIPTQASRWGSSARYGRPSGATPWTYGWARRTTSATSSASRVEPNTDAVT
jgi:hypothetical protein